MVKFSDLAGKDFDAEMTAGRGVIVLLVREEVGHGGTDDVAHGTLHLALDAVNSLLMPM